MNYYDDDYPYYDDYPFKSLNKIVKQIFDIQNSETYKQKIYDTLDKFISETKSSDNINDFSISCKDLHCGKKMYNKMKNDPKQNYDIFGSNGCGYTCFGLYKSKDQNIYIIVVDVQTPIHYIKIEDENIFGN